MKFGIAIPTDSDSWRLVRRAEAFVCALLRISTLVRATYKCADSQERFRGVRRFRRGGLCEGVGSEQCGGEQDAMHEMWNNQ